MVDNEREGWVNDMLWKNNKKFEQLKLKIEEEN